MLPAAAHLGPIKQSPDSISLARAHDMINSSSTSTRARRGCHAGIGIGKGIESQHTK